MSHNGDANTKRSPPKKQLAIITPMQATEEFTDKTKWCLEALKNLQQNKYYKREVEDRESVRYEEIIKARSEAWASLFVYMLLTFII